ncbi:hypothetical protein HYV80_03440 [Candidatus Woesearchaeota archaeon]|nr:hypothetical protein [Candidatus Woesearchaeota archaeon]
MHNLADRLEKTGWKRKDIIKAVEIIKNAKKNKPKEIVFIERRIFWILLLLIIAANFSASVALLPLLVALNGYAPYAAVIALGLVFGFLFEQVIRSMEHLEKHHHLFLAFLMLAVSLANIFVISRISNNLSRDLNLANAHNPAALAISYAVSFALPFAACRFVLKRGYYSKK